MSEHPEKHYYTLAEANAQVASLKEMFGRVMQLRLYLKALYRRLEEAGFPPTEEEVSASDVPEDVARQRLLFQGMAESLKEQIEHIQTTGCVIQDIESGIVDWLSRHQNREIWLCWKYGESEVRYWHELNTGYGERRPVSEIHDHRDSASRTAYEGDG